MSSSISDLQNEHRTREQPIVRVPQPTSDMVSLSLKIEQDMNNMKEEIYNRSLHTVMQRRPVFADDFKKEDAF